MDDHYVEVEVRIRQRDRTRREVTLEGQKGKVVGKTIKLTVERDGKVMLWERRELAKRVAQHVQNAFLDGLVGVGDPRARWKL